jgi:hypothetical protein
MTLKVYLLSSLGAGLSSVVYSFKSCDFSFGPFLKIQESLGFDLKSGSSSLYTIFTPQDCTLYRYGDLHLIEIGGA